MALIRLLLIDDCEKYLTGARFSLRAAGYCVETADDRDSAVQAVAANPFDLILIPAELAALTAPIRASERAAQRPPAVIVALVAERVAVARPACVAAGMNDCDLVPTSRSGWLRLAARWTQTADSAAASGLQDLVPAYLVARRAGAIEMRARLADRAFADISAIAHRMRGTGGTYGFPALTSLGAEIETAAAEADVRRISASLDALDAELRRASGGGVIAGVA